MSMGKRLSETQSPLFILAAELPESSGHPYYQAVNALFLAHGFDLWVQEACRVFYAETMGRPGVAPGVYFRCLLIGYLEGIDSERGIAWRAADSLSLRGFLGIPLGEKTPDHSTLSRTRRLMDLETHTRVFTWMLKLLAVQGVIDGKTIGIDATTLEANAAMRSIVRKDSGASYEQYLTKLAQESGIETPTREQLAKLDRKRKNKASNDDWKNPHDPDAKIAKMKDGTTHLAHKAEHAVDMGSGVVVAVTLQPADAGDTSTLAPTILEATTQLRHLADDEHTAGQISEAWMREVVTDKGYHSNATMTDLSEMGIRSYVSEPDRGRRGWEGKPEAREAVYANRRRIRGERGKDLLRDRGEFVERSFAHCYETGALRRTHLRGHENILKRLLLHVAGFNLSVLMRRLLPAGKPRGLQGLRGAVLSLAARLCACVVAALRPITTQRTGPRFKTHAETWNTRAA